MNNAQMHEMNSRENAAAINEIRPNTKQNKTRKSKMEKQRETKERRAQRTIAVFVIGLACACAGI